jgi:hypothetical protein
VAQVLWVALLASVVLYVAVAHLVPIQASALPTDALVKAFYVVSLILFISSILIQRRMLSPELVRKYAKQPVVRTDAPPNSNEGRALLRHHADLWVLKVSLISWAMAEAIALLGLVAALIACKPSNIYPFAATALLAMVWTRPDFSAVDRALAGRTEVP